MKKMWIHKNEVNKVVPEYDFYYVYAPQGYTRGRTFKTSYLHLNDKVEVKVKGKWRSGVLHDIYDWCWIVLCDRYMLNNSNMVIVKKEDRRDIRKVS